VEENNIMNKNELITAVADKSGMTKKETEKILKAFTETVTEELKKGGKVQIVGVGTFEASERAAREGRNPHTGEAIEIEASRAPRFKAGRALKEALNEQ
jgi:DNA-binding protein HU-beta